MKKAIGIDIGGTKIAAAIVYEDGTLQHQAIVSSDITTKESLFQSVCRAVDQVLTQANLVEETLDFGVGVPGLVDRINGVAVYQNNLPWPNFPIAQRLRQAYPKSGRIVLDNDVYQAALAEWRAAQLNEGDLMIYLTVSTGISSAILFGGDFLRGNGFAGEVGLLPIRNHDSTFMRLEKTASGPALAEFGREAYNDGTITARDVFARYDRQDETAVTLLNQWADDLSGGIYSLLCVLDPQKIVLGGSVVQKNKGILPLIKLKLAEKCLEIQKSRVDVLKMTDYENDAGIIGAGLSVMK